MVELVLQAGWPAHPSLPSTISVLAFRVSRARNPVVPSRSAQLPTESSSPSPAELSRMWHSQLSHFQLPVICKIVKNGYSPGGGERGSPWIQSVYFCIALGCFIFQVTSRACVQRSCVWAPLDPHKRRPWDHLPGEPPGPLLPCPAPAGHPVPLSPCPGRCGLLGVP